MTTESPAARREWAKDAPGKATKLKNLAEDRANRARHARRVKQKARNGK